MGKKKRKRYDVGTDSDSDSDYVYWSESDDYFDEQPKRKRRKKSSEEEELEMDEESKKKYPNLSKDLKATKEIVRTLLRIIDQDKEKETKFENEESKSIIQVTQAMMTVYRRPMHVKEITERYNEFMKLFVETFERLEKKEKKKKKKKKKLH